MIKRPFVLPVLEEITEDIDEAFSIIAYRDYLSFILLIGRADMVSGLKEIKGTDCVIDYQLDSIYDETRTQFYLRYLRRNYGNEGFCY